MRRGSLSRIVQRIRKTMLGGQCYPGLIPLRLADAQINTGTCLVGTQTLHKVDTKAVLCYDRLHLATPA